jgi:hypothetical protein
MGIVTSFQRAFNTKITPFHRFVQWTMRKMPFARRFAVWGDELFGFDKPDIEGKWWFDLEDVDGVLQMSPYSGRRGNHKEPKRNDA